MVKKELAGILLPMQEKQEMQVQSLGWEVATTPVFLPGKFHGQRSLEGYSPEGNKESHMTEHALTHIYHYI